MDKRIDRLDSRLLGLEVGIAEIRGHLGLLGAAPTKHRTPLPADSPRARREERHPRRRTRMAGAG